MLYHREGGIAVLCLTCNKRCSEGSTIARMAWPPLSTIKSVSDTLRVFYLSTRAIEISFNPLNRLPSAYFVAFVYAVRDAGARSLMPAQGTMAAVQGKNVRFQYRVQLLLSFIKN